MGDITNPRLLYAKGVLFLCAGATASGVLLLEHPSLRTAALLAVAVWCFARAYYFAFYVIERYVDPGYRFAGIGSLALYLLRPVQRRKACVSGTVGPQNDGEPKNPDPNDGPQYDPYEGAYPKGYEL